MSACSNSKGKDYYSINLERQELKYMQNSYLIIGEHSENVQFSIWSKSLAFPHAGYHTCYKSPMA